MFAIALLKEHVISDFKKRTINPEMRVDSTRFEDDLSSSRLFGSIME